MTTEKLLSHPVSDQRVGLGAFGSTAEAPSPARPEEGTASETPNAADAGAALSTVYQVTGMTCGHCESAVAREISGIQGVTSVQATASTGRVTVVSQTLLDEAAIRAAVDEAGYELVGKS